MAGESTHGAIFAGANRAGAAGKANYRSLFQRVAKQVHRLEVVPSSGRMKTKDVELLRRSDLFRFLSDDHFAKVSSLLQEEEHDFGELIVKQGDPANAFYILISG